MDPTRSPQGGRGLLLAGLALAALYVLARMGLEPPAAKPADAPANEFSATRALAVVGPWLGEPHPSGTPAHARMREGIVRELERLGYAPQLQESLTRSDYGVVARLTNVLAKRAGTRGGRGAVLLCAHYDSVAAGPGAGDDGAGVAALLEIARALAQDPPAGRDVVFLFDDAEELGLVGAHAFVEEHPLAKDVELVINVEARGTSGPSMMFETSDDNLALMNVFTRAVKRPVATSVAYEVYKRLPNDTDLTVFKAAGMRGFNFAFIGGLRHYHTPLDDLAHLSPKSVQHHGDNVLALVRALSAADFANAPSGRAVYTDVFGAGMVVWPESVSVLLAIVAAALLALAGFRRVRQGLSAASIGWGAIAALECIAGAAAAGWLVLWTVDALRDAPEPWAAHPTPMRIAIVGAAAAVALFVSRSGRAQRAGFEGQYFGAWALFAACGIAAAATAPSACYVFVLPGAIAALCALLWSFLGPEARGRKGETLVVASLVPLCAMWFPLAIGLELSFELRAGVAIAGACGVAFAAVLPLAVSASARAASIARNAAIALCLGALCSALLVPAYSAEQPDVLSLVHFQDADRGKAIWSARATPRSARATAKLVDIDVPPPERWLASELPEGEYRAPSWSAAAPELAVLDSTPKDGATRRVKARLRSVRAARLVGLDLPPTVRLAAASWRGHSARGFAAQDARPVFAALGEDPVEIELEVSSAEPVEIHVFDVDASLPAEAAALLDARPPHRVPRAQGDGSIVRRSARL